MSTAELKEKHLYQPGFTWDLYQETPVLQLFPHPPKMFNNKFKNKSKNYMYVYKALLYFCLKL